MARCTIDIDHPYFVKMFEALAKGHPDAKDALLALKAKIEENPEACHRRIQPMPKHPECHGKIWKYDWAPASVRGSTRKSWRLVVFVKDATCNPMKLVAMACYSKSDEDQLSLKALAGHMKAVQLDLALPSAETAEEAAQGSASVSSQ